MLTADLLKAHEKLAHKKHQLEAVEQLVKLSDPTRTAEHAGVVYRREIPGVFALFDEVGAGKTKVIVDTSQILWLRRELDTMCVIGPGFARSTWSDPDPILGEVALHAWDNVPNVVHEYHGDYTDLDLSYDGLHWIVSNFEFIRREDRLRNLIDQLKGRRTWVVVDESWAIKGNSDQTRACIRLRRKRGDRATILNGTPLSDGKPSDLYYQMMFLDPDILGCKTKAHFKSKYLIMGGYNGKSVVDYQNLDELNARIAPYVLSRKTRDCHDLPPMLPPITIEARLSDKTWKVYREMRDDLVAWLGGEASIAKQAIVKILRLAQITSGFLGGLEELNDEDAATLPNWDGSAKPIVNEPMPAWLRAAHGDLYEPKTETTGEAQAFGGPFDSQPVQPVRTAAVCREISREKLDAFLNWLDTHPNRPHKLLTWCRFRPELERLSRELEGSYPKIAQLRGGQTPDQRRAVKHLLAPGGDPKPAAVVGITGTGAASLNFSAASVMVFMSHDPALIKRTQSIGRIERPGQKSPMLIVDVVATGPKGQKTYDHHVLKALRGKHDTAQWTVQQWRNILKQE